MFFSSSLTICVISNLFCVHPLNFNVPRYLSSLHPSQSPAMPSPVPSLWDGVFLVHEGDRARGGPATSVDTGGSSSPPSASILLPAGTTPGSKRDRPESSSGLERPVTPRPRLPLFSSCSRPSLTSDATEAARLSHSADSEILFPAHVVS